MSHIQLTSLLLCAAAFCACVSGRYAPRSASPTQTTDASSQAGAGTLGPDASSPAPEEAAPEPQTVQPDVSRGLYKKEAIWHCVASDGSALESVEHCSSELTAVSITPVSEGEVILTEQPVTIAAYDDEHFERCNPHRVQQAVDVPLPASERRTGRVVTVLPDNHPHRDAIVVAAGLPDMTLQLASLKVDLDGDGVEEILFSASGSNASGDKGVALMGMHAVGDDKKTQVFLKTMYNRSPEGDHHPMTMYSRTDVSVSGFTDIEGDGVLEVAIYVSGWEDGVDVILHLVDGQLVRGAHVGCW